MGNHWDLLIDAEYGGALEYTGWHDHDLLANARLKTAHYNFPIDASYWTLPSLTNGLSVHITERTP